MAVRSKEVTSRIMSAIRGKNTGIEKALRKALTEKGVRYRLYSSKVFGHPDLCLPRLKIAIFCDSEFWHGYHFEENEAKIKTNRDYWIPKIKANIAREKIVNATLTGEGYTVLRYWGYEIEKNLDSVVSSILETIKKKEEVLRQKEAIASRTTLCYIERGDEYLFLHRVKKEKDVNAGKYIGVGGHIEPGESPTACMKREILEETGLRVKKYAYLGKIDFLNDLYPPERMYLYKVTAFEGELSPCDEGDLVWVKKNVMMNLNLWEGDRIFLPLLEKENEKPFQLDLHYSGDVLVTSVGPYFERPRKAPKKKKRKS